MSPPSGTAPAATVPCGSGLARERLPTKLDARPEEILRGQGRSDRAGAGVAAGMRTGHPILALGAWFKHAACLLDSDGLTFGPNLGDLDNAEACAGVEPAVDALLAAASGQARAVAHDLHPDFHSTRVALATAHRLGVPAIGVQHHHAHIGAVLAEHARFDAHPVLGLALDGVGLGSDGEAWGGELLLVEGARFQRLGRLRPLRLPGGDRAAREPWRMAAALLHACGRGDEIADRFAHHPAAAMLAQVLARPALSPPTSSLGRHFDAAAALLGICERMRFEAEAAIALERLAARQSAPAVDPADWHIIEAVSASATGVGRPDGNGVGTAAVPFELDLHPLLRRLADAPDAARGAARFHATLAAALIDWVRRASALTGCDTVVLGGGCLHNRLLADALHAGLPAHGFKVLGARSLSPGDAALALGQAWVALHQLTHKDT
ncbi:carbamoyltransferase HypF [Thauera sp. JM12B12]|uniref:Kae1-like domain-containing protein n=1 Tax=Thauera sp. JM12B12 TaxID=3142262 RepID=UPI0031F389AD